MRTEDRPRGDSVGQPGLLASLTAVGEVVPLSHASSQAELGLFGRRRLDAWSPPRMNDLAGKLDRFAWPHDFVERGPAIAFPESKKCLPGSPLARYDHREESRRRSPFRTPTNKMLQSSGVYVQRYG